MDPKAICISIDVERDFRTEGSLSTRGIREGLPVFLDVLRSHHIPFDLMVSGEVVDALPEDLARRDPGLVALGSHGMSHSRGYLNRMSPSTQSRELTAAGELIRSRFHRSPVHFRAPNFSANADTIRTLQALGYVSDSSVLPGRNVRRWRIIPLVDHRGTPQDPYVPDLERFPRPGHSNILEIPVAENPALPGSPLGLGFLNAYGPDAFLRALSAFSGRYAIVLAHPWEMVSWNDADPVAPWVRSAARSDVGPLEELLSRIERSEFLNSAQIADREKRLLAAA